MFTSVLLLAIISIVGGALSFFSPCTAMVLPSYFAYTFNGKIKLLQATFLFALGLAIIYIPLALGAATLARLIRPNPTFVGILTGLVFISAGVYILIGKHVNIPILSGLLNKAQNVQGLKHAGPFLLGIISGIGSSPCAGPIIGAILTLSAATQSTHIAVILLSFYIMGIFIPLLLISWFLRTSTFIRKTVIGKTISFNVRSKKLAWHSTQFVSGLLFLTIGGIFLLARDINVLSIFLTKIGAFDLTINIQDRIIHFIK